MRCPHCRQTFDMMELEMDQEWRKIIDLRFAFDKQGDLVWEYCHLFGITPLDAKRKKLLRLLEEVGALFSQKRFKWKKATYEISEKGIIEGLKVTCNANLITPIKDHNYLRAVLASISQEEQKTLRITSDATLRKREQYQLTTGSRITEDYSHREHRDAEIKNARGGRLEVGGEDAPQTSDDFLSPEEMRIRCRNLVQELWGGKTIPDTDDKT